MVSKKLRKNRKLNKTNMKNMLKNVSFCQKSG